MWTAIVPELSCERLSSKQRFYLSVRHGFHHQPANDTPLGLNNLILEGSSNLRTSLRVKKLDWANLLIC